MSYKKNAVSYGIWALYLMGIGIVLSFMGMVVGGQNTGVPYMAFVLLALVFGVLFLVYYAAKKLVDNVQIRKMTSGRTALIEGITVAVLLVAGLVLRLALLGSAWEEAAYYEVAKVTEEGMRVQLVQGSVYYYLCLLNLLFRLVGNKWMAGIILQIVLQMLGIVIAYFAVKRLSGRGPALVSLLFLTVAPVAVKDGIAYSPKMLYFCIYSLILLIIAQYLWRSTRPGAKALTWLLASVCGALVAFAGYTDIVGFTLASPLCGLLVLKREQRGMLQWVAQFMLSMLVMAGTFCLLVFLDSAMSGTTFERVLGAWGVTYGLKGADYGFFFQEGGYETILLLVLMALGIFTFMRRKNEEIFSPWVMMVLSVTLMRLLGFVTPNMNGSFQMYFAMTGLAGVAFCELFVRDGGRAEETAGAPEEADAGEEPTVLLDGEPGGPPLAQVWSPEQPLSGETVKPDDTQHEDRKQPQTSARKSRRRQRRLQQGDTLVWESLSQENDSEQDTSGFAVPTAEVKEDMTGKKQSTPEFAIPTAEVKEDMTGKKRSTPEFAVPTAEEKKDMTGKKQSTPEFSVPTAREKEDIPGKKQDTPGFAVPAAEAKEDMTGKRQSTPEFAVPTAGEKEDNHGKNQATPGFAVPTAEVKEDMTGKKQEEIRQVQLIENPLPLPKKHVKRVMDYPIQPDASQMHYDIRVDPNDDFDF